jgi:hypothetical protein
MKDLKKAINKKGDETSASTKQFLKSGEIWSSLQIDNEIEKIYAPLEESAYRLLRESISNDGIRDALVVWKTKNEKDEWIYILLDGHNRYRICKELDIEPKHFKEKEFENKDEAIAWVEKNNMARRNLTKLQLSFIRGSRYLRAKKKHGGHNPSKEGEELTRTREIIAQEFGVGASTISRDLELVNHTYAVDEIISKHNPQIDFANSIRHGRIKLNNREIKGIFNELKNPEFVKAIKSITGDNIEETEEKLAAVIKNPRDEKTSKNTKTTNSKTASIPDLSETIDNYNKQITSIHINDQFLENRKESLKKLNELKRYIKDLETILKKQN